MEPLISIIIPVFNKEVYLKRCLSSVLNQTLKEIEVIVIDDGSTDLSLKRIMEIVNGDKRVKVISQVNQGCSIARNNGIEYATAKYIGFVDPDDYIKLDMYEKLYKKAIEDNADMVVCGYLVNNKEIFPQPKDFFCNVWSKLIKSEIIKANNIKFPINSHFGEDLSFIKKCELFIRKISLVCEPLYIYSINETSVTNSYHKWGDIYISLDNIIIFYKNRGKVDKKFFSKLCIKYGCEYYTSLLANINFYLKIKYGLKGLFYSVKYFKYCTFIQIIYIIKVFLKQIISN